LLQTESSQYVVRIGAFARRRTIAHLGAPYFGQAWRGRGEKLLMKNVQKRFFERAEEFLSARTYLIFARLGLLGRR
jgi:hypothetical protein